MTFARHPGRRVDPRDDQLAVDGVSDDPPICCEAWAHQGPPKAAQRAKVAKDVLKLTFLASLASTPPRLILLFSDEAACAPFRKSLLGQRRYRGP